MSSSLHVTQAMSWDCLSMFKTTMRKKLVTSFQTSRYMLLRWQALLQGRRYYLYTTPVWMVIILANLLSSNFSHFQELLAYSQSMIRLWKRSSRILIHDLRWFAVSYLKRKDFIEGLNVTISMFLWISSSASTPGCKKSSYSKSWLTSQIMTGNSRKSNYVFRVLALSWEILSEGSGSWLSQESEAISGGLSLTRSKGKIST